jgi:ABC-type Mn2+/Zn2+ transport system ATPase subunit
VAQGARWIRAALQVNPYAYEGANQPSGTYASEPDYNKALLDECEALDIGLIAVTDHWCVDSAASLLVAASERGIVALPGFEANSSEGVHLLVIFEAGTELSVVNAAIGACGVEPECANGTTGNAFKEILQAMTERGALVIPAHANVPSGGMLTGRTGQPLVGMVKDPNLHAVAITPSRDDATDQVKIAEGRKPYDRKHPLAVIHADDIMHPDEFNAEGATSWFKVSKPSLESLKLAVRTPETRVALSDPAGTPRALLCAISWTGGFLDGVRVPISSDLTALIGGRGTGKSTVIESLRYGLGLEPIGADAAKDHKSIVDKVVRSGTIIKVEVDTVSPSPRSFTIERVVPDPPLVRDASGTATNLQPSDVAGLVELFGQHELAELAGDPTRVAEMLQRFAGSSGIDPAHQEILDRLAQNREQLAKTEGARAALDEELSDIPRLEEQIQQFKETDVETRLADLKRLDRDESVFTEAAQRLESASRALVDVVDPQLNASLTAEYDGLSESPRKDLLHTVAAATANLATKFKALASDASAGLAVAEAEVASARAAWDSAVRDQRDAHADVLRKLHEDGLEPDKYLATTKALDDLKAKQPRLASHDKTLKNLEKEREELLGQAAEREREQLEALHDAVRSANEVTDGVVIVRPIAAPDRQHIFDVIAGHVAGQRGQIVAAVNAQNFSPRAFVIAVRAGVEELEKLDIRGAQAVNLIAAGEQLLRELEELSVGHAVEVLLDVSSDGRRDLKTMDELSKGQRATALLLLLLGASVAPLVIDQPEDDLDNRFVYDGVVQRLRKLKGVRQVIVSTHNANVPVLGDAELIVALEGDGQHGQPAEDGIGSLDDATIRSMAENILEGGPAAFNARQHLYGF